MLKWFKITKNHYFGLFGLGFLLFALQELPYIIMPLITLSANPLMEMQDKIAVLNFAEKTAGVDCIIVMLFLVRADAVWFSLKTRTEKIGFSIAATALIGYYAGWVLYFCGFQNLIIMLGFLVALPPIYYAFIGIWRKNYLLFALGLVFLAIHIANVSVNLL
jgi:hypothetical protein